MKKIISLGLLTLMGFGLVGCGKEEVNVSELQDKIDALEKENKELRQQVGIENVTDDNDKKEVKSSLGSRSNPVPIGEDLTFNPLYNNQEVSVTADITDIQRGKEAEQYLADKNLINVETALSNTGGLKENTELVVYTLTIKLKNTDKDEGINLPDTTYSLNVDGDNLGYSYAIRNLEGFNIEGQAYVDKEYKFRMYGQIEKGKEGLVSLVALNPDVFFKVN